MSATSPLTTTTTFEDKLNNNNTTQEISYLNIPIHEIIQKTRITHGLGNNSGSSGGVGSSSGSGSGLAGCFLGIGDDDNDNNNHHHNNHNNDDDSCSTSSSSSSQNGNNNNNANNEKRKENNENDLYGYTLYRKYCTRRLARLRRASSVRSELSHGRLGGGGSSSGSTNNKDNKSASSGGGYKRNEYRPLPPLTTALSTSSPTSPTTSTSTTPLHENHVLVLVFQSERAWSRAMEARCILENMKIGGGSSSNQKKKMIQTDKLITMSELKQNYQGRLRRVYKEVLSMEEFMNVITATNNNTTTTNKYGGGLDKITQLEIRAYASWMKGQWFLELGRWKVS